MKILYMGTPDIAAESLKALIEQGHEICGVFTREDKPVGRKQVLTPPPVKVVALENNIELFQPKTLREGDWDKVIKDLAPEIIVVVAYGRILPKEILDIPAMGCINLHVSLLPKYRGAAPIQWSVINGDKTTGVTIMQIDEGLDTGDIIYTKEVEIDPDETSGELFDKVSSIGAKVLCETIENMKNGNFTTTKQDESKASLAPPLKKEMANLDFSKNASEIHNLIRGLNPWPVAFFVNDDKKVKVLKSKLVEKSGKVGEILSTKPFVIACDEGAIMLETVVPEGKKAMDATSWAMGKRFAVGDIL